MLNQLPPSLQNLLNKNSNKLNLISEEYQKVEVSEEQASSFDNIFFISSLIFSIILGSLTYINFQKSRVIDYQYLMFKNNIAGIENSTISAKEMQDRVAKLNKYTDTNRTKIKIAGFFELLTDITKFLNQDQLIQINYSLEGKNIDFQIFVNSTKKNLDQELNAYFRTKLSKTKIELVNQILVPNTNLTQYEFKGKYGL